MNKQILKLFNKAGFHQPEMERLGIEDKFEKFAELIVRECMAVADTYQNRGGNCYVDDMIAKHFGVEE